MLKKVTVFTYKTFSDCGQYDVSTKHFALLHLLIQDDISIPECRTKLVL